MRKILIIIFILLFSSYSYAGTDRKIKKSGFINNKLEITNDIIISDPKNKIIIIENHGQKNIEGSQKHCFWTSNVENLALLAGEKINGKEIMVYIFCTNNLKGDDAENFWNKKWRPPYKGKMKLDKRVDANLNLIKKITEMGVPKKQIFVSGHSCGGLVVLMLASKHMDKIGGGIAKNSACYGKLSRTYKVSKVGSEKALEKFKKKLPGVATQREMQINEIKKSKTLPILAFTHPQDPFEGLLSDWLEEIPGIKRIVISEDLKINGKSCKRNGKLNKNAHLIDEADCFRYYDPVIKEYIATRIK